MPKAKKTPVKRKYTKKQKEIIGNIELGKPDFGFKALKEEAPQEIDEIAFLDLTVQQLDQMDSRQKSRYLNYIYSRYIQYFGVSNIVNP